jgi:hypothetical protein
MGYSNSSEVGFQPASALRFGILSLSSIPLPSIKSHTNCFNRVKRWVCVIYPACVGGDDHSQIVGEGGIGGGGQNEGAGKQAGDDDEKA